jgi:hypothetical protein
MGVLAFVTLATVCSVVAVAIQSVQAFEAVGEHPRRASSSGEPASGETRVGCGGRVGLTDGCGNGGDEPAEDYDESLLDELDESDRLQLSEKRHKLLQLGFDASIGRSPASHA